MLNRRELLRSTVALPLAAQTVGRGLNVLLIAVDDLNNRIGCYGDPLVKTPNLDRLAKRGVRFDRSYCNYPLCNPSRTSLLSGRRPETTQIFDNGTPPRTTLGDVQFLPEYFKAHGYFTARVGKIAHGRFEHFVKWDVSESRAGVELSGPGTPDRKQAGQGNEGGAKLSWRAVSGDDASQPDGATARRISQLLEQSAAKGQNFFIGCGFHKPHLPWVAPAKYFDMYSLDQIQLPKTPANDHDDIPPVALTSTKGDAQMDETERKKAVLAYHAATSFMDAQLGVVLDTMDRLKLWDNTVVLLFGDHGWHLNDHHQLWRKMTVFEEAARAPMIVAAPGARQGVSSPRLVEYIDIYPSLVSLAGLPAAPGVQGSSFAPLLKDPMRPWKRAAYTVVKHGKVFGYSVRTGRYRYTEWDGGKQGSEFYDHETDRNEWTNLAAPGAKLDNKQNAVLEEMQTLLRTGHKSNVPPV
ncbi:MAG: sulfatase [Acidobacteria bacterium]|nr:sulfatase [Acidobacteriota bacterium]